MEAKVAAACRRAGIVWTHLDLPRFDETSPSSITPELTAVFKSDDPNPHIALAAIELPESPTAFTNAGFSVTNDNQGAVVKAGAIDIRLTGSSGKIRFHFSVTKPFQESHHQLDGIPVILTKVDQHAERAAPSHLNNVVGIDHVVIGTTNRDQLVADFARLGLQPRRTREAGKSLMTFFRAGPVFIEVVGPAVPEGDTKSSQFWGLTFEVDDIDKTKEVLGEKVGLVKEARQGGGQRITTLRSKPLGIATSIAFISQKKIPLH